MAHDMDVSHRARLVLRGKDAAAFMHRLSTQHVKDLAPGSAVLNVLCTDKGRIKDLVHHIVLNDGAILLVGHTLDTDALHAWLDRYCFTEDVTFEPFAGNATLTDGVSERARTLAPWQALCADDTITVRSFDHVDDDGRAQPTFVVLNAEAAHSDGAWLHRALLTAGAPLAELAGEVHTPLDLALHDAIHWAKGCYIGQEVIARLDTYGKQRRRLVGVRADAALTVGADVVVDGVKVGTVTSCIDGVGNALVNKLDGDLPRDATVGGAPARLIERLAAQAPHD